MNAICDKYGFIKYTFHFTAGNVENCPWHEGTLPRHPHTQSTRGSQKVGYSGRVDEVCLQGELNGRLVHQPGVAFIIVQI